MSQKLKAVRRQSRSPKRTLQALEPQCSDETEPRETTFTPIENIDPTKITDRPSPRREGSIEGKDKSTRLKGSLKVPRGEDEPPFTLRIPITEGNDLRKSITWSRSSRCYLYAAGDRGSSLGRCLAHKTCPFLLVCCVLPTILIAVLCFFLIPIGKDDDTIGDDKFDYYKIIKKQNGF